MSVAGKGSSKTVPTSKNLEGTMSSSNSLVLNHVLGLLNRARFRQFKKPINYSEIHFQLSWCRIFQTLSVFLSNLQYFKAEALIGYVLSDTRFDRLLGNTILQSVY